MTDLFRDRYAIVGVGVTPTARSHAPDTSGLILEAWAARLAMADAGLDRLQIDGAVHAMMGSPHPPSQWTDTYSRTLGLKPNIYLTIARGGQAAHNGLLLATQLLATGISNYVIVSCGLASWSATRDRRPGAARNPVGTTPAGSLESGLDAVGFSAGAGGASLHGFMAARHMHEYGTTQEQFGAVAVATRAWANLNPDARFHDRPMTLDDYLASPYVIEPMRRLDCCIQSDLGAALVVTTSERARDLPRKPIFIKGIGMGDQAREQWWNKSNYTQVDGAFASKHALGQAGVRIEEIDVAELYDCFTSQIILYLEDYGWCDKGEGGPFVETGATAPGGSIPVNTFGGLLSGMYLFDFPGIVEAVRQLRGEAGARQVADAKLAITNGHGGEMVSPFMCSAHATMVLGNDVS